MNIFIPVREKSSRAEGRYITTYGIAAYQKKQKVAFVQNVSPNLFLVICLCLRFNILKLSPFHLADVLNDML